MTKTTWHEHLGALFTVIIASSTVLGTGWIACNTAVSLRRLVRSQKAAALARRDSADTRETEAEEEELRKGGARRLRKGGARRLRKGGARRLRKVLVVCLMAADGLIALSTIGPATMGLTGVAIAGAECDPAGMILAMGLWWQYGFSLVIAITTYIALRHPLSRIKRIAEQGPGWMIALVLSVGVAQAILWRYLHGYVQWRDYCFYGPPTSKSAELFQFIPRLLSSLAITTIYIPLIHFLRRPDLSALYLSPRPASLASARSSHDIPPWERLSFPNFTGLGLSGLDSPHGSDTKLLSAGHSRSSISLASPLYPVPVPLLIPEKPCAAYFGETKYVPAHSGRMDRARGSTMSGSTLVPSLRVHIIDVSGDLGRKGSFSHASTRSDRSARSGMTGLSSIRGSLRSVSRSPSPSPRRDDPPPLVCMCDVEPSFQPSIASEESGPTSPASLPPSVHRDIDVRDDASFRGMLDFVPCQLHPWQGGTAERPSTPTRESMASFMNRRTSSLLIWFPLTHLVICAFTLVRYIYFNVEQLDGKTIEALSVVSLLVQGFGDVIVFGLIERRTQQRYRVEMALCTPARNRDEADGVVQIQQY